MSHTKEHLIKQLSRVFPRIAHIMNYLGDMSCEDLLFTFTTGSRGDRVEVSFRIYDTARSVNFKAESKNGKETLFSEIGWKELSDLADEYNVKLLGLKID